MTGPHHRAYFRSQSCRLCDESCNAGSLRRILSWRQSRPPHPLHRADSRLGLPGWRSSCRPETRTLRGWSSLVLAGLGGPGARVQALCPGSGAGRAELDRTQVHFLRPCRGAVHSPLCVGTALGVSHGHERSPRSLSLVASPAPATGALRTWQAAPRKATHPVPGRD